MSLRHVTQPRAVPTFSISGPFLPSYMMLRKANRVLLDLCWNYFKCCPSAMAMLYERTKCQPSGEVSQPRPHVLFPWAVSQRMSSLLGPREKEHL